MKKVIKGIFKGVATTIMSGILIMLSASGTVWADQTAPENIPITVELNGQPIAFEDVKPVNIDGSVLVPMRMIFESLGAEVLWDEETQTATGILDQNVVRISVGSICGYVNEQRIDLTTTSRLIDGRTMVPVRFVSEGLAARVDWIGEENKVIIQHDKNDGSEPSEDTFDIPEQSADFEGYAEAYLPMSEGGYFYLQSVIPDGGCLLTCVAMVASNLNDQMITPEEVYAYNGNVVRVGNWDTLEASVGIKRAETIDFSEIPVADRLEKINELLATYPEGIIIGFCKPGGSWHYVVAVGYDEINQIVLVNDPVGGHRVPLAETWTGNKKFTNQDEAIEYLQNGKTYVLRNE